MSTHVIRKFNPGMLQSDEEVIGQFAIRQRELAVVLEALRENIDAPPPSRQHPLLIAPRGRGKTMLLARVTAELHTDPRLASRLFPVRFMEENHEIANSAEFWLETLFHLAREVEATGDHPDLAQELQGTHAHLATRWQQKDIARYIRNVVLDAADRLDRKLVLMIENLQDLCDAQNDPSSTLGSELCRTLEEDPRIMLLGTAIHRPEGAAPLTELFQPIRLEPLNIADCQRLWQMASGDEVTEREIRPLQILTGGSPRFLSIAAELARHQPLQTMMETLITLIDSHTEYFQRHLKTISSNRERLVYLAMLDLWQPSTTAEITARARMDIRVVSSLLRRLISRGVVTTTGRSAKKQLYGATERLYSIYYKLRRERDAAVAVRNLIHFMEVFYGEDEKETDEEAIATFDLREAYRTFLPEDATMTSEMLKGVTKQIAEGMAPGTIADILSNDPNKSDALRPLIVALQQLDGRAIRAPVEIVEIAEDIRKHIETRPLDER